MKYKVLLTGDAARDLQELFEYIAAHDSSAVAMHVPGGIEKSFSRLEAFPDTGNFPKELLAFGIREYRETLFKPYRIIYRVSGNNVYVYLITDGRRDMQTLLARRLLGA